MSVYSAAEIADKINQQARELAPELLPNGRYNHNRTLWQFSGIPDTGRSSSAVVYLSGPKTGKWFDYGNAAPGEDKGDMLDLLRLKLGLADAAEAFREAKQRLGIADTWDGGPRRQASAEEMEARAREARARAAKREAEHRSAQEAKMRGARALFLKARPIAGTPAEAYLLGRGLEPGEGGWPGSFRFHPEVWNSELKVKVPAMVSAVVNAQGVQTGVHRIFLQACPRRGWTKLDCKDAKLTLGAVKHGFIPINKGSSGKSMAGMPEGEPIYATEGVEDAMVVRMMKPDARIVATVFLKNFGFLLLPPAAKKLVIVADRDTNAKAQDDLERAIATQQARGLDVRLVMPPADVDGTPIKDLNDWLLALTPFERLRVGGAA